MSSTLLGPQIGYVDLLDQHISQKNEAEAITPRRYNPLRPSAAGKCAHELAIEYAQYKGLVPTKQEVIKPDLSRIFSLGHSVEWNILKSFEETRLFNVRYRQQVVRFAQLSDGTWLEGSIDMTMFVPGVGGGIGDVKSKKDRLSSFASTGWDEFSIGLSSMKSVEKVSERCFWVNDLDSFLEELQDPWIKPNFVQLNMYANTDFIKQCGIDHGFILQYNKNDSRLREIRFRPSETVYKKTIEKLQLVHDVVTSGEQPSILKCATATLCRYCWNKESLAAYYATLPPKKWPKDVSYLKNGEELEAMYATYQQAKEHAELAEQIEDDIVAAMGTETKVRFADGAVYEAKFLKTQGKQVLRRGKA